MTSFYPSASEMQDIVLVFLSSRPLTVPELCVNAFPHLLRKITEKAVELNGMTLTQFGFWLDQNYPIEWIIVCQAVDELLGDELVEYNELGQLQEINY